jgi:hypothetical protein
VQVAAAETRDKRARGPMRAMSKLQRQNSKALLATLDKLDTATAKLDMQVRLSRGQHQHDLIPIPS